jgi:membrane protein
VAGLLSIVGLMWSASGMMGALRRALNQAWDTDYKRKFLHGKLLDFVMVLSLGILMSLSVGATIFLQVARRVSDDLSDALGPLGSGATLGLEVLALFVPLLLSFVTFMVLFKFVPSVKTRFRSIWPGALLAAVLFEGVKNGFAIYLRYVGDYDAVYGSLGTVVAFLFFVYVSANIMLLGAEMAAEWPRVIHGHYDDVPEADMPKREDGEPRKARWRRLRGELTGLFRGEEKAPDHIEDRGGRAARRRRKTDEIARRTGQRQRG